MADYFVAINGQQHGPFPIHELLSRGTRAESLVWHDGMGDWQRADTVPELASLFSRPMPPPMPGGAYSPPIASYAGAAPYNPANSNRVAAGICGILLGGLGVHKFILGMTGAGLTMLLVTLLTCGFGGIIMHAVGIAEGIIYLTKTDPEFHQIYVVEKKAWF